jgi:GT2 family glycosyltransferase
MVRCLSQAVKPVASVIIPAFGERSLLDKCLDALQCHTTDIEVIVIDNGMDWQDIKAVAVVHNPENKCYAVACNQGSTLAHSDILVMLNMDTEVQPDWLSPLLAPFDDPEIAMTGPRIVHPDLSLQTSGIITWHGNGSAGGQEIKEDLPTRDVDGVTGACMVVRKSVYDAVGGMYSGYWAGNEDVDLCLTIREAGYRIRYCAQSQVTHIEGASGAARWVRVHENVALLNQRWGNR